MGGCRSNAVAPMLFNRQYMGRLCPGSIPNELSPKTIRLGSIPVTSRGKDNLFREPARHEPRKTFFLGKLDKTHCDATVHRDATSTFYKGGEKW